MSGGWEVEALGALDALAAREAAWRATLAEAATGQLFLEPEWVLPLFETYGGRPRVLLLRGPEGARAAALLEARCTGGARVLRPPGLGVSDYLDLLLPDDSAAASRAVATLLDGLRRAGGWDLFDLPNLPSESPTAELVVRAARERGMDAERIRTYGRPFLTLEGSWERFLGSRPQKLRYNLRTRRRQLAALGEVRYRHYTRPEELAAPLERAVAIHARRWAGQRTGTTFSRSERARRFYAEAARRLAARGWLDFSTLELDGRPIAFCLGFVYRGRYHYYLPAFEPELARFGPSTDLLAHLIERAYGAGLAEFDFMLGDEVYKAQWASGRRWTWRVVVAAPSARGRVALAGYRGYLGLRERARRSATVQRVRRYGLSGGVLSSWSFPPSFRGLAASFRAFPGISGTFSCRSERSEESKK